MEIIIPYKKEKYSDYIKRILNNRENIKDENVYQERHHITPKCLGGSNDKDNLIYLYAQEHYYAHKLLALENPNENGLQYAWWNMCHCGRNNEICISSEDYEISKKRFSKLVSEELSGENSYWYGKKQSDLSNKKRSEKLSGEKNPMYGRTHSEECKNKISQINKGKRTGKEHHNSKKVRCINTDEIFDTATEAAVFYGLKSRSSITLCCKKNTDSAGKHPITREKLHWEYVE